MNEETHVVHVDNGRIEIWRREDGVLGLSLLPDDSSSGTTYMPGDGNTPHDFPQDWNPVALEVWGRQQWAKRLGH